MALRVARDALSRIFYQRCFYLFGALLALISVVPFLPETIEGRIVLNWVNVFLVVSTVAAVGRSVFSFVLALLLGVGELLLHWTALKGGVPGLLVYSWMLGALLYAVTAFYLLRYVFDPQVMTTDKLFGAAAAFLVLGVLWAYLYTIVGHYVPKSFIVVGAPGSLDYLQALYLSISVLTSNGFGDISPLSQQARGLASTEQVVGALFLAVLIARLAADYPRLRKREEEKEKRAEAR